jgi:integrase
MSTELVRLGLSDLDVGRAEACGAASVSDNTKKVYATFWAPFATWCAEREISALPASGDHVALFLYEHRDSWSLSTCWVARNAIGYEHRRQGAPSPSGIPVVARLFKALSRYKAPVGRDHGGAPPATTSMVTRGVTLPAVRQRWGGAALEARARAALLVGFYGQIPLRHLTLLSRDGITSMDGGLALHLPTTKGNPNVGVLALPARTVHLEHRGDSICPVEALKDLLELTPGTLAPFAFTEARGAGTLTGVPARVGYDRLRDQLKKVGVRGGARIALEPHVGYGLSVEELARASTHCNPELLVQIRDRAYLTTAFCTAVRPGELASMDIEHLRWDKQGATWLIPVSKTDQIKKGRDISIPHLANEYSCSQACPACRLRDWIEVAGIVEGSIFQSVQNSKLTGRRLSSADSQVILRRLSNRLGLETCLTPYSLRKGFITEVAGAGADADEIAGHTGHQDPNILHRFYVRFADLFDGPAHVAL